MMKTKNIFWRKILASFAVGGVILSGLVLGGTAVSESPLVTDASAGVAGGGGGGGGGGSSGTAGAYWVEISRAKLDSGRVLDIPGEFWNSPVCRNATKYYGLVGNFITGDRINGGWTYGLWGVRGLNGSHFSGGSGIASAISSNTGNSYQWSADYMYQKNFICLDNPNRLTASEWRYEVRSTGSSDSLNLNEVHTLTSQVSPQAINIGTASSPVMRNDPVGAENLNSQISYKTTNYGKVWNEYKIAVNAPGADAKNIVALFKDRFTQAIAQDSLAGGATVNLNDDNLTGLAEGGILNINEYSKNSRAAASTATTTFQVWRCGYTHYSRSGWQPSSANNCGIVTGTGFNPNSLPTHGFNANTTARWLSQAERNQYTPTSPGLTSWTTFVTTIQPSAETQKQTGFWQIISAHCNEPGIVALREALGDSLTTLDSGDDSSQVSALLKTKLYPQQPAVKPLGDPGAAKAAQKATSMLGFFDKECPFDCTPSRSTSQGASDDNGAKNNIVKDGFVKTAKGNYGAKSSDSVNSSYAELFRDNVERTIRPDVWYPVSGSKGVSYDGAAPKSTLVTRWAGGTPTLGTEFNAYAGNGNGKVSLFDSSGNQETQKNFDAANGFASSTAGQVPGFLEEITIQSTWASTSGRPQGLQVAWEYSPSVTSRVPTAVGFGLTTDATGALTSYFENRTTKVDGRCWGEYGTAVQTTLDKTKSELNNNTGTGADTNFAAPDGKIENARNLVLNFVRGTGE